MEKDKSPINTERTAVMAMRAVSHYNERIAQLSNTGANWAKKVLERAIHAEITDPEPK